MLLQNKKSEKLQNLFDLILEMEAVCFTGLGRHNVRQTNHLHLGGTTCRIQHPGPYSRSHLQGKDQTVLFYIITLTRVGLFNDFAICLSVPIKPRSHFFQCMYGHRN